MKDETEDPKCHLCKVGEACAVLGPSKDKMALYVVCAACREVFGDEKLKERFHSMEEDKKEPGAYELFAGFRNKA